MFMQKFIKKQVILIIITFVLLAIVVLGSSFALFQKTIVDTKTQSINLGDLNIAFSSTVDNTTVDMTTETPNAINMTNVMPKTDEEAAADNTNIYTFAIYNSGNIAYNYKIKLEDNANATNTLDHQYIRYKINNEVPWLLSNTINGEIYSYIVNPGETHTFTLKIWLAEPEKYNVPNEALDSEIHLNINITGEASNPRAPKGWKYAKEGTLLYGIKQNEPTLNTGGTIPGEAIAETDEGLKEARDDYGTSYYYRGAVEDNYVVFANKCWRIVRIVGDGSIKLVLHNNDEANCVINDTTKNFAKYDGIYYKTNFNSNSNIVQSTLGIGFMYGNINATTYLEAQANTYDSTILTNLKAWYDLSGTFTNVEKNMLADVIWCGDKSLSRGPGYGQILTMYGFNIRKNNNNTSLVCPNIEGNIKLSKYTASTLTDNNYGNGALNGYKIGLLTGDEMLFAGGSVSEFNTNFYLFSPNDYWSMTGTGFNPNWQSHQSNIIVFTKDGLLLGEQINNNSLAIRPAIALKSNVKYTVDTSANADNPGTVNNPFVIVEE